MGESQNQKYGIFKFLFLYMNLIALIEFSLSTLSVERPIFNHSFICAINCSFCLGVIDSIISLPPF